MSNFLMVPIRMDALYVPGDELTVLDQIANFPVLPYFDRVFKEEINCETPNISEAFISKPFQNKNLRLGNGIHLHWALPDALTRAAPGFQFPEVPNRWLVTRRKNGVVNKQWIVESDYLFPPNVNKKGSAVSIPYFSQLWQKDADSGEYIFVPFTYQTSAFPQRVREHPLFHTIFDVSGGTATLKYDKQGKLEELYEVFNEEGKSVREITALREDKETLENALKDPQNQQDRASQPYRYMGRKMPVSAWRETFPRCEYHSSLTAVGYGDPTFAAFYPNCFSVFGFHDSNPGPDLTKISYEIAGWYNEKEKDILARFVEKDETGDIKKAVKEKFNWNIDPGEADPDRLLCYAGLTFTTGTADDNLQNDPKISITVANTPTEALSARLADKLTIDETDAGKREKLLKSIEDQLEAMQLAFRLDEKELDTVARFKELRHENGFTPVESGQLWVIRKETTTGPNDPEPGKPGDIIELPVEIAEELNRLNTLQKEYNHTRHEIDHLRKQLFADWYKYMICVYPPDIKLHDYPDPDLVKYFIKKRVVDPLNKKIAAAGEIQSLIRDSSGNIRGVNVTANSAAFSMACRLQAQLDHLILGIENAANDLNKNKETGQPPDTRVSFHLEQVPGPRHWQPNNPVILIEGDAVKATKRHGQDGVLTCRTLNTGSDKLFTGNNDFTLLTQKVNDLLTPGSFGLNTWNSQPWNPFLLEWQTRLFITETRSNLHLNQGIYAPGFITENYEAPVLNPDLELKPGRGRIVDAGKTYEGQSILTAQANPLLTKLLEKELIENVKILEDYLEENNTEIREGQTELEFFKDHFAAIKNWITGKYSETRFDSPVFTMIHAYETLKGMDILSQSLNGFNEALLMHKQTMELVIDDPLGFPEYRDFSSDNVADVMGNRIKIAPSPLNTFNPIRSGCLKLLKLRLVDTFGQTHDLDTDRIDTTYKMTSPHSPYLIKLPPRLIQPARINFRWINAVKNRDETNSHTATSPICGWLLTNTLDNSIMVYEAQGKALGYFKAGLWREAIDSDGARQIDDIKNTHLKRVARWIDSSIKEDPEFLGYFIGTIDDALANIEPEKHTGIQGPALLMGRPVAVVRASVNLELCGPPAVNQDWSVFRRDMAKGGRTTDDFTKVQFPVRLGEYGQLNDGLIGYWLEKKIPGNTNGDENLEFTSEYLDKNGGIVPGSHVKFYSPQSDYIDSKAIESAYKDQSDPFPLFDNSPINFYQSIGDEPQTVTMLMDVQGTVHVTAGILPNKEISIPQEQYTRALQDIEISFLHAPLLTQQGKINLPLHPLSDYEWSWVERDENRTWKEFFPENRIEKTVFKEVWEKYNPQQNGEELWNYLFGTTNGSINWLSPVDDDEDRQIDSGRAKVVNKDDRIAAAFTDNRFLGQEMLVEAILDKYSEGLDPPLMDAVFTGPQEIKEGWLKLRYKKNDAGDGQ